MYQISRGQNTWGERVLTLSQQVLLQETENSLKIDGSYIDKSLIVAEEIVMENFQLDSPYRILYPIDVESSEGRADVALLNDGTQVVMKQSLAPGKYGMYLTCGEAAIGLLGLNHLQSMVPNFMKVFGVIRNSETECSAVLEYVEGEMLSQFVQHCSIQEFKLILLQLFNALHVANKLYGFTHGGLHSNNVIVKRLPNDIEVRIYSEDLSDYEVRFTNLVPVIIDYGKSSLTVDGFTLASQRSEIMDDAINDCIYLVSDARISHLNNLLTYVSYLSSTILVPRMFLIEKYSYGKISTNYSLRSFLNKARQDGVFSEEEIQRGILDYRSINAHLFVEQLLD